MKKGLIFRFRIGAKAVLAANRLINVGQHSQKAFIVRDLFNRGDAVSVLAGCINMASGIENILCILMPSKKIIISVLGTEHVTFNHPSSKILIAFSVFTLKIRLYITNVNPLQPFCLLIFLLRILKVRNF